MGQYYMIVNLDKEQFIHPHEFGDGLKLMEFAPSGAGVMMGLAILLASSNGKGGGDLDSKKEIIGSWAGDRIVIAGDYDHVGRFLTQIMAAPTKTRLNGHNLYSYAQDNFEDVSEKVKAALRDDCWSPYAPTKENFEADFKSFCRNGKFNEQDIYSMFSLLNFKGVEYLDSFRDWLTKNKKISKKTLALLNAKK